MDKDIKLYTLVSSLEKQISYQEEHKYTSQQHPRWTLRWTSQFRTGVAQRGRGLTFPEGEYSPGLTSKHSPPLFFLTLQLQYVYLPQSYYFFISLLWVTAIIVPRKYLRIWLSIKRVILQCPTGKNKSQATFPKSTLYLSCKFFTQPSSI